MSDDTRRPVIVGVGDAEDRPEDPAAGLDPVQLAARAARAAAADAGGDDWLRRCDWLALTPQISFRHLDAASLLPAALGIAPGEIRQAAVADGDVPVRHLNDAANAIAAGRATVCLLAGAEAVRTAMRLARAENRPFTLFAGSSASAPALRRRYGLVAPAEIYPLYENACRAAWGQTLAQGQAETARIWSIMSEVAADTPGAWLRTALTEEAILRQDADNRPVAFPYSKLTVANAMVNQGAAVIVTSLAAARAAGIAERRLVFIGLGAAAHEDPDPLQRATWTGSPAMRVALQRCMRLNRLQAADLDHVELYSCFPCVPKMARRVLDLSADRPLTVQGGLTFGGGPIGNFMMHATVAMTRRLREAGQAGLLYGNGGHCTHNHAIVLLRAPPDTRLPQPYRFDAEADALRGPIPPIGDDHEGPATVETYTVMFDRSGTPERGVVMARDPHGGRVLASVAADDLATIAVLTDGKREPVGMPGLTWREGALLRWRPAA